MITFKEFINEQEDDPYQAFLKMRQSQGWGGLSEPLKGTHAPTETPAPAPTRTGTRTPLEIKLSNEVQTGHKMGGLVSRNVIDRLARHNPDDIRSFISPDTMKAGQAYPFIQKRMGGKDVKGVYFYNQMFPLYKLLELLNLH